MDYRYCRSLRIISTIVLSFFIWTFGGVFDIAYAIKNDSSQYPVVSSQGKNKNNKNPSANKAEHKFQKTINDIENILADTVTDTKTKKVKIKTKKSELEALDIDIRKQFKETEGKIVHTIS